MGSGVALKPGIQFSESSQFTDRKITGTGKARIKQRRNMTIRKEKKIFTNPIHVEGGVMFHCLEIQGC
jgi:hypothetical protein